MAWSCQERGCSVAASSTQLNTPLVPKVGHGIPITHYVPSSDTLCVLKLHYMNRHFYKPDWVYKSYNIRVCLSQYCRIIFYNLIYIIKTRGNPCTLHVSTLTCGLAPLLSCSSHPSTPLSTSYLKVSRQDICVQFPSQLGLRPHFPLNDSACGLEHTPFLSCFIKVIYFKTDKKTQNYMDDRTSNRTKNSLE